MGILNGNVILSQFHRGLYNRCTSSYEVYVDGELMRYKGMTSDNLVKHDAEHAVAHTAYTYLCKLLSKLESHLGGISPQKVTVFMDGKRVTNKVTHCKNFQLDASLIRNLFIRLCISAGMFVNHLEYGESELQMHIQHNIDQPLTVYITCDSDLVSILYGHRPNVDDNLVDFRKYTNDELTQTDISECPYITSNNNNIDVFQDANLIYGYKKVKNSIAWLNCAKDAIVMYGMDNTVCNSGLEPLAFRTFMAVCGTDFTPTALTSSMMSSIQKMTKTDLAFINSLDDLFDIFASLLIVGYKLGGSLKQKKRPLCIAVDRADVTNMIKYYIDYVSTGVMTESAIPQPPMPWLTRYILWCATDVKSSPLKTRKAQTSYFAKTPMSQLVRNVSRNFDNQSETFYSIEFAAESSTKK